MKRFVNRRSLALLGMLLTSQLLTACVVVPARGYYYYRPRPIVIEPGYDDDHRYHRDHDRRDWDDHR